MHFMGQSAISRPTRATGRLLVSVSLGIIFVKLYDIPIENINFYEITLPKDAELFYIEIIVVCFILASHLINWYGDLVSYRGWNISDKITSTAGFGTDTGLISRLESILRIVKEKVGNESENHIVVNRLEEMRSDAVRINSIAWWYIYIWHLAVPVVVCAFALAW